MPEFEFVTWDFVMQSVEKIVEALRDKKFIGIYAVPRGGNCLGTILSYRMNIPLLLHAEENALIIDDISDTGKTLYHYEERRDKHFIVTLYYKRESLVVPDLWFREKTNKWVVFPWENQKDPK